MKIDELNLMIFKLENENSQLRTLNDLKTAENKTLIAATKLNKPKSTGVKSGNEKQLAPL